jgi:hypothetical protein
VKRQLLASDLRKILPQLRFGFPSPPQVSCPVGDVRFAKCGLVSHRSPSGYAPSLGTSLALKLSRIPVTINCRFKDKGIPAVQVASRGSRFSKASIFRFLAIPA